MFRTFLSAFFFLYAHVSAQTLQTILMGRCLDRTANHPYFKSLSTVSFNCTAIWDAFLAGNTTGDFTTYFQLTDHPIPPSMSLFWTGSNYVNINSSMLPAYKNTRDEVHFISLDGLRFWTLEDTLWGFLLNGLTGYNGSFWTSASAQFASHASGNVHLLAYAGTDFTSGTVRQPYRPTNQVITLPSGTNYTIYSSIFANTEIFNLRGGNITSFTIWLLVNGLYPNETCGYGSVGLMAHDLQTLAGGPMFSADQVHCANTPDITRFALCMDNAPTVSCEWKQPASADVTGAGVGVGIAAGVGAALLIGCALMAKKKSTG